MTVCMVVDVHRHRSPASHTATFGQACLRQCISNLQQRIVVGRRAGIKAGFAHLCRLVQGCVCSCIANALETAPARWPRSVSCDRVFDELSAGSLRSQIGDCGPNEPNLVQIFIKC